MRGPPLGPSVRWEASQANTARAIPHGSPATLIITGFIARDANHEDHVKLIDLGFAQEPGVDTGDGVNEDSPGSLVGTIAFMADRKSVV